MSYGWHPDPEWAREHFASLRAEGRAKAAAGRMRRCAAMAAVQQGLCTWCWRSLPRDLAEAEVDHIIPRCLGGPDVAWNRQLLHEACNRGAGKFDKITPDAQRLAAEHGIELVPSRRRRIVILAGED